MATFFVSAVSVALAEIGDKTQLLALVLAARFGRPWPILGGILVATLANHAIAAALGVSLSTAISPDSLRWAIALSFIGMGLWALVPDRHGETQMPPRFGPFVSTAIAFFIVEIGDKTQIATALLAANYATVALVVVGTTLGMLAANVPVVFAARHATRIMPLALVRAVAAALFVGLGILALLA